MDPDGRAVIVLNRSYGAGGMGHNAVMIGNDKDGWIFYSKDGPGVNTRIEFETFDDFIIYNSTVEYDYQYDRAAKLETIPADDKKMQIFADENYNLQYALEEKTDKKGNRKQNCADFVYDVLSQSDKIKIDKPKIHRGDRTIKGPYRWRPLAGKPVLRLLNIHFRNGEVPFPFDSYITYPDRQFENFINNNKDVNVDEHIIAY